MLRVIGYVRVSTDEQAREGYSLETQASQLRLYGTLHDLDLTEVITDDGYSAKNMTRPGLARVRELLDKREVDGLLIAKLDRLTRSLSDWAALIDRYFRREDALQLFSVKDHIDTASATGRLTLNIIMTIAEWEREIIVERTTEVLRGKIARGERVGKVRYGYDLDCLGPKNDRGRPVRLIENAAEQAVIARMRALSGDGVSLRGIRDFLRELGIETKEGNEIWTPGAIARILQRTA